MDLPKLTPSQRRAIELMELPKLTTSQRRAIEQIELPKLTDAQRRAIEAQAKAVTLSPQVIQAIERWQDGLSDVIHSIGPVRIIEPDDDRDEGTDDAAPALTDQEILANVAEGTVQILSALKILNAGTRRSLHLGIAGLIVGVLSLIVAAVAIVIA